MKTFFFFGRHEGKLETFAKICVVASLETLREDPTVRIRDNQAAWKLLSKISRIAPAIALKEGRLFSDLDSVIFFLNSKLH